MLEGLIARAISFAIRALTGARGLWRGCAPAEGLRVYYGNHASHGDFVLIWSALPLALRRNVRPVAGADYWNRDALRRYVIRAVFNGVLVERGPAATAAGDCDAAAKARAQDAIATLCEAVDGGASLIVFPEGTRNPGDGLLPFKSGIYHLACRRPELEFVPVWLDNLARVMPKGRVLPLPLLCTATFGEPLRLHAGEDKAAFVARARDALLALAPPEFIAEAAAKDAAA
ncbi:lysophospholipid acyltransferase family protein [Lysobacter solisilvae (ex Woo and Kim 2020)]|uniref:1-acyl-sn-glycerol-3-phosphate acyltransferase n=1 Tax=Agrilutibacter terrestris TaxID=2865112 RepID=A0A7H0FZW7_9GAMM|nr:lysophospholipid acyltransferase family protein [Lysobacter terrestris]QNP41583.1 1-acyl-sn-glycerol-3-phosphate acyltransferase [Lysobacter terrestris]